MKGYEFQVGFRISILLLRVLKGTWDSKIYLYLFQLKLVWIEDIPKTERIHSNFDKNRIGIVSGQRHQY